VALISNSRPLLGGGNKNERNDTGLINPNLLKSPRLFLTPKQKNIYVSKSDHKKDLLMGIFN